MLADLCVAVLFVMHFPQDILILYFCRKDHVSYEVVDAQNSSRECHKVKRFIEHNYQSMISLDSLAENCSLSKYNLSHRFAELYWKYKIKISR